MVSSKKLERGKVWAVDLCSGAGGVTTGFKAAGIDVVAALDLDPKAMTTYQANHPGVYFLREDLLTFSPEELRERVSRRDMKLCVLTACVPCQAFSTLGNRNRSSKDSRYKLVQRIGVFAADLEPAAIVMENVPPLQKDRRFRALVRQLREIGYGVWSDIVNAADFGVPQRRRRLIMIAMRGKRDAAVPRLGTGSPKSRKTVREVLDLVAQECAGDPLAAPRRDYPPLVLRRIQAIPHDGGSRSSLPDELVLSCHKGNNFKAAGNVYGRMKLDEVAPTLTTRCTTPSCGRFLHPTEDRAITLREAATLQGFPLDYKFEGGSIAVQAQIGNAVPPPLAEALGKLVLDSLANDSLEFEH